MTEIKWSLNTGVETPTYHRGYIVRSPEGVVPNEGNVSVLFEDSMHIVSYPRATLMFAAWPTTGLTKLQEDRLCYIEAWTTHYKRPFWWGENANFGYSTIMSMVERDLLSTVQSKWCVKTTTKAKAYLFNKKALHSKLSAYYAEIMLESED